MEKWHLLIEMHRQYMVSKGYSHRSLRAYREPIREFLEYLRIVEKVEDLSQVDRKIISRYQGYLYSAERKLGLKSQSTHLTAIRSFFRLLERENLIFVDPSRQIELPKEPQTLPRDIMTEKEVKQMLNAVATDQKYLMTEFGIRDKAMLELLYATGMRSLELVELDVYDVDRENKTVLIRHGKGDTQRVIPVGEVAMGYIEEYLEHGRPQLVSHENETALFVSTFGRRMLAESVPHKVQKYAKLAGIERPVCAHMIRHSMATHMLRKKAPIRYIQEMLGHKSLNTTQIYTHVEISDLKKVHAKTHPRETG